MDIGESRNGETGILTISGRLDASSSPALPPRASALCDTGIRTLLIDLQQVEYLTSAGFRALIAVKRQAERASVELALCGLNEMVHDLFEVGGLLGSFSIHPDATSALASVAKPGST
jgi:anti-anti-sigma factor